MNDDFEEHLAKQPLRPIPPEWRVAILGSAKAGAAGNRETSAPTWRVLLWPSPLAWAGVCCAWVLIIGMNIAARPPAGETSSALPSAPSSEVLALIIQERQALQELQFQQEPVEPPPVQTPPGACNDRRKEEQIETA